MPTPSITASRHAQPIALLRALFQPPRTANAPPVKNPAIMALYGSSFFRTPFTAQSNVENRPPCHCQTLHGASRTGQTTQTPKFPPSTGARALIAVTAPIRRSPYGEFRKPFTPCQTAPPMPPIQKAPPIQCLSVRLEHSRRERRFASIPKSLSATHGQGSVEYSELLEISNVAWQNQPRE